MIHAWIHDTVSQTFVKWIKKKILAKKIGNVYKPPSKCNSNGQFPFNINKKLGKFKKIDLSPF